MFSDKQKQSWHNIKAPDGLLEKIESAASVTDAKPKTFKRIALPLIAASFMFIFAAVLLIGKMSNVDVYLDNTRLTQNAQVIEMSDQPIILSRSSFQNLTLTLTVDADADTLVKTDFGEFSVFSAEGDEIYSGNEYTISEKSILIWTYQFPFTRGELSLECGMHKSIVEVEYDEINAQQTVKCLKN